MRLFNRDATPPLAALGLGLILSTLSAPLALCEDEPESHCKPYQWGDGLDPDKPLPTEGTYYGVQPGEINCRFRSRTPAKVDRNSCWNLARSYKMSESKFFFLNPGLEKDCSNLEPLKSYCVQGCEWRVFCSSSTWPVTHVERLVRFKTTDRPPTEQSSNPYGPSTANAGGRTTTLAALVMNMANAAMPRRGPAATRRMSSLMASYPPED